MFENEAEKQKELFDNLNPKDKGFKFFRGGGRLFANRIMIFQISFEKMVFLLLGIIVLAGILFCLGVERGKCIAGYQKTPPGNLHTVRPAVQSAESVKPASPVKKQTEPFKVSPPEKILSFAYAVQLATYSRKKSAQEIVDSMKKEGFPAYWVKSGKFFVIYLGDYKNRLQAETVLAKFKKIYKGCRIRTIKK